MDCIVCFCPIDTTPIKCSAINCDNYICIDCIQLLITYSKDNNLIPTCPSSGCNAIYLYSKLNPLLDKDIMENYELACLNGIVKKKGDDIEKEMEQERLLNKLREEKKVFVQSTFPIAITRVANVALKHKLHTLEKSKRQHITDKLKDSKRRCMNLICKGHLNSEMQCLLCESKFCNKCERLLIDGHQCKKDDIESLNYVNNMIHCPTCNLPIEKSYGCNNMTCAYCGTHFDYNTGQGGYAGNEGTNHYIQLKNTRSLSFVYSDIVKGEKLKLIDQIEQQKPVEPSEKSIHRVIKDYYNNINDDTIAHKLALELDKYTRSKIRYKLYTDIMIDIENKLTTNKLEEFHLHKYINYLNNQLKL